MSTTFKTNDNRQNKELPEGYTPLEYIEYHPKQPQMYMYGNFERYKDAIQQAKTINELCKNNVCGITIYQTPDDVSFRVVFSEHVFDQIDFISKQDCELVPSQENVSYNIPMIYRFIEERYIDSFFQTGTLKFSTFEKCKKLEDANRNDTQEGISVLNGYDGKYQIQCKIGVGCDAIILCTSLCNSYTDRNNITYGKSIEIFNVPGFISAISEQLKKMGYGLKSILFGPCFYSEKEFHKEVDFEMFREKTNQGMIDWDEMMRINQCISGPNIYFQKPIDKRIETEFRMIWLVDDLKGNEDIYVTIQNPEKYCKKVSSIVSHL